MERAEECSTSEGLWVEVGEGIRFEELTSLEIASVRTQNLLLGLEMDLI